MSKKGLSLAEKRTRLLDLFHESKDFYKLQDLEKIAPKLKGITAMSVKEVLTELVNDNLVTYEKIGIMNFYWSFPSTIGVSLQNKRNELEENCRKLKEGHEEEERGLNEMEEGREDSEERQELLKKLLNLQKEVVALEEEEKALKDSDPNEWNDKQELVQLLSESKQFWTENISQALSFMYKDMPMSEEEKRDMEAALGLQVGWEN